MRKKMYSTPVIVLAIIGACMTMFVNCISIGMFTSKTVKSVKSSIQPYESDDWYDEPNDWYDEPDDWYNEPDNYDEHNSVQDLEGVDPSTEALSDIPTYEAENVTVSYTTDSYQLQKSFDNNAAVYLDVKYPVVSGTDEAYTETINNILKDQAMVSADNYYLNVEGRSKLEEGTDGMIYIVSEVTYEVTYLSDDFISVVYEDNYCTGDYNTQYIDMRSCNIDLKTGKSYDLSQIVKGDLKLAENFQQKLDDKYQYLDEIYGIDTDEYASMISGEKEQDDSFMGFYSTEDGVELYLSFHYFTEEESSVGWLTAPYRFEDLKEYQNQSDFWNIAQ